MNQTGNEILLVAAMAAATMLTRFLPFLVFRDGKETPPFVIFLGRTLPYATIGMLVIYCLKTPAFSLAHHLLEEGTDGILNNPEAFGIPEWMGVFAVAALQKWKKNSLLSIGAGTILYMALVQAVF